MNPDVHILAALRRVGEAGVSGAELAQKLAISRAAVWARVQALRELGYDIVASPHHGYRLDSSPDLLNGDDLMDRLSGTKVIGREVHVFNETSSTNDIAEKMGRDGVKEGVVVFAESQSKGRGRLGRSWLSMPGKGLWFSVLLRPPFPPQAATRITVAAATALARAIQMETSLDAGVKWPNDIFIQGRKVCGILTELSAEVDHLKWLVLGVGVNVNFSASDFPADLKKTATSLRIEKGSPVNRAELASSILRELDRDYARVCAGEFEQIASEWEELCVTLGREVRVEIGDRRISGRAEALDPDGALLVRTQHGRIERIIGGDVILVK